MSDKDHAAPLPPTTVDNLAGDADVDPASGYLEVDYSVPSHPVIRFRADKLPEGDDGSALSPEEGSGLEVKENGKLDLVGRAAAVEGGCGGSFAVHEIKYKDANGDTQIYHLLSCDDIDLTDFKLIRSIEKSKSGKTTTVTITLTDGTTKTFTVEDGEDGTDGADGVDGEDGEDGVSPSVTIADITDEGGNVVGHTISITDAEHDGSAEHPAQVFTIMNGVDGEDGEDGQDGAPGANASVTVSAAAVTGGTQVTITPYSGSTAGTPQSFTVLDGKDGKDGQDGAPGADGQDGEDGQDATVTTTTTPSDCVLSTGSAAVGSSGEAARADHVHKIPSTVVDDNRTKDLKYGNTTLGKIVASQNATITPLLLAEGSNITFTRMGNTIVINASTGGGSTSGYTTPSGTTDTSIAGIRYDVSSHKMQAKYHHDVYANGLLTSRTTDTAWQDVTGGQAVEETA